ncbi:cytoplasmic tRNA 2-thiolation protein 2 isoform X2 [Malania oleifera]|uniref:cytoplasmic tRNA 2-thiolation protein 2 isoform X2 n=1 Tax=Malania oleifera TaxID=397392 RepID=UPI0025AE0D58|nr:cytoplasmic tRNA 2-thiolation protein 2 isoform X2 [Malania oleifera]
MACNSGNCQSGCYKDEEEGELLPAEKNRPPNGNPPSHRILCVKCKANAALSGDDSRHCSDCFRSNLYGKFRFAVTSNAMISPSDNVLVAFSGGTSSRVALQFVHEMQCKALKNFEASRDRSLPVFGVGVAFIDESTANSTYFHQIDKAIEDMKLIVSNLAPPAKEFHVVPIESICSLEFRDGRDGLKELLNAVTDVTGKEDLLLHLRMLSLQKIALDKGYTKLLLGSCTSRIASHVISATVKGQGYSLSADIQYVDARWEIPVVLPLRNCLTQELNMLCRLDGLKTMEVLEGPHSGINGLVSSFVKLLQEENPSRESTIVRTAGKLIPFQFNKIPDNNEDNVCVASWRRVKKFNYKPKESIPLESLCPICCSPLNKSNLPSLSSFGSGQTSANIFRAACCPSCQFQILPRDSSFTEHFCSLLPKPVIDRAKDGGCGNQSWLREQIQDCLLSDGEDGS